MLTDKGQESAMFFISVNAFYYFKLHDFCNYKLEQKVCQIYNKGSGPHTKDKQ